MKPENLPENLAPTSTGALSLTAPTALGHALWCIDELDGLLNFANYPRGGPVRGRVESIRMYVTNALADVTGTPPDVSPPNEKEPSAVSPAQHDEGYVRDALRYRWLRASADLDGPHVYGPDDDCIIDGDGLDAAIDASAQPDSKPE